ncbi:hypothetical protein HUK80_06840 [Flavobacterium sp. MAH-1]|uniref:DUF4412 domain-containing protein n=1 Tax=Flavobacterium agri TaxID=2743471 RepID=A0A7Y8Y118_9FLAO|nr:hypothetical protein [Flavobacterium agri]NUY80605.1 hypothetical protein [Flavobacterium agri]NYA70629.1 hypothetical protein [Flavobacterium agri]
MKHALFLLLWCTIAAAQKPSLQIAIDSISHTDIQNGERKYKLHFHLHNPAKKPISFLLKPNNFSSIQYGSMSNSVHYKIYEENQALDLGDAFDRYDSNSKSKRVEIDASDPDKIEIAKKMLRENFTMTETQIDEYIRYGKIQDSTITYKKRDVLSEVLTLKPGETKSYSQVFFWDKELYFRYDENEFYIDPKKQHYLELVVLSMREPFKSQMTADDYKKLETMPDFVSGVFTSNRILIDFTP